METPATLCGQTRKKIKIYFLTVGCIFKTGTTKSIFSLITRKTKRPKPLKFFNHNLWEVGCGVCLPLKKNKKRNKIQNAQFMTELLKPADTPTSCKTIYKLIDIYPDN